MSFLLYGLQGIVWELEVWGWDVYTKVEHERKR